MRALPMREPLPIDEVVPRIVAALRDGPAVVVEAPPGAGKTTRVPPALLDSVEGEVVVLEPRRLAARTAARRVAVEYAERPDRRPLAEQVAAAVRRLTVAESGGDVLVFLPGAAEIARAREAVAEIAVHRNLLVLPLHGDLPPDDQDRVFAPDARRKVILSTNVAETSVTVPGVRA